MKKKDRLSEYIQPKIRFFWGLSLILPWLFMDLSPVKALFLIIASFYLILGGKRIYFSRYLILTISLVVFHLFVPYGKVYFRIGFFSVTEGALFSGLSKAVTLSGLMMISLFSVTRYLEFKGIFGKLIGRMFYYFEKLTDSREQFNAYDKKNLNWISRLDELLFNLESESINENIIPESVKERQTKISLPGTILILIPEIILWGNLFYEKAF